MEPGHSAALFFGKHPLDNWRIRDACEGTQIFGATGSGKTTGSGQALARAFLENGFGGLVLCAKPEEPELWQNYADQTGRGPDVMLFSREHFNFLHYEANRPGVGAGQTENLVMLFMQVAEIASQKHGTAATDDYWERAVKHLLRNAVDLIAIARGAVTLPELFDVIRTAPQDAEEAKSETWQKESICFAYIQQAAASANDNAEVEPEYQTDGQVLVAGISPHGQPPAIIHRLLVHHAGRLFFARHPAKALFHRDNHCARTHDVWPHHHCGFAGEGMERVWTVCRGVDEIYDAKGVGTTPRCGRAARLYLGGRSALLYHGLRPNLSDHGAGGAGLHGVFDAKLLELFERVRRRTRAAQGGLALGQLADQNLSPERRHRDQPLGGGSHWPETAISFGRKHDQRRAWRSETESEQQVVDYELQPRSLPRSGKVGRNTNFWFRR